MNKPLLKRALSVVGVAFATAVLIPSNAAAHLVTTGMGPVYDGIGHLLLTPEDLVPALAVALYAGLRGKAPGKLALFFFPLAWLFGGVAGMLVNTTPSFSLSAISFLIMGALIAADLRLPEFFFTVLLIAVGCVHGFFNGIAMRDGPGLPGLLGIAATLFVVVAIASAVVASLRPAWTRVAVRVAGSWIAAMGILMIGWYFQGQS